MSAVTRSRSSFGSTATLKSCGPSSRDDAHVHAVLELGERLLLSAPGPRWLEIRSWSSMALGLSSEEPTA